MRGRSDGARHVPQLCREWCCAPHRKRRTRREHDGGRETDFFSMAGPSHRSVPVTGLRCYTAEKLSYLVHDGVFDGRLGEPLLLEVRFGAFEGVIAGLYDMQFGVNVEGVE